MCKNGDVFYFHDDTWILVMHNKSTMKFQNLSTKARLFMGCIVTHAPCLHPQSLHDTLNLPSLLRQGLQTSWPMQAFLENLPKVFPV